MKPCYAESLKDNVDSESSTKPVPWGTKEKETSEKCSRSCMEGWRKIKLAGKINCKILTCQNFEMPNSKVWLTDCNFNIVSKTNLHTAFCNNFLVFFLIAYFLFLKKYIYLCFSGVICMYFIISAILLVANKLLLAIFQIICLFFMTQKLLHQNLLCVQF